MFDPSNMQALSDRVRGAFGTDSARRIGQMANIPPATVQSILNGSMPRADNLLALARAALVSTDWLLTGDDALAPRERETATVTLDRSLIEVPRYDIALSAGSGAFVDRAPRLDSLPFPPEFFTRRLNRKPDGMIIVDAKGDSMLPTLADRDLVMIDTADTQMTSAIWAFTYGDEVYVKRLNKELDRIEVIADNTQLYRPFMIEGAQLDRLHLIGRVVWVGRTL